MRKRTGKKMGNEKAAKEFTEEAEEQHPAVAEAGSRRPSPRPSSKTGEEKEEDSGRRAGAGECGRPEQEEGAAQWVTDDQNPRNQWKTMSRCPMSSVLDSRCF
jgi:hypothetical protein